MRKKVCSLLGREVEAVSSPSHTYQNHVFLDARWSECPLQSSNGFSCHSPAQWKAQVCDGQHSFGFCQCLKLHQFWNLWRQIESNSWKTFHATILGCMIIVKLIIIIIMCKNDTSLQLICWMKSNTCFLLIFEALIPKNSSCFTGAYLFFSQYLMCISRLTTKDIKGHH